MNKKFNVKKFILFLVILILILFFILGGFFFFMTSSTGKKDDSIEFEVVEGSTYYSLIDSLKEEDLIKSSFFFKIYLKLKSPKNLDAGIYILNKGMNNSKIIDILSERNTNNPNAIDITLPEGTRIEKIAEIFENKTNTSKEEYLSFWNSEEFINSCIENYWFITDNIKKDGIKNSLEGYFFPSTYEFQNKDVTPNEVAIKLLDQMENVLNEYKEKIESSSYTVHEYLTLASIIEYEAGLDEDRKLISGVFYNRLNSGMKLESCATVGYAIDEWKMFYTTSDLKTDSPYNTYYYVGLPIGPANAPSKNSIEAAINPTVNDYLYFIGDVCSESKKTYYSKTYSEHEEKIETYLTC